MAATSIIRKNDAQTLNHLVSGSEDQSPPSDPRIFRILDLPYEVRVLIYNFVFTVNPNTTLSHAAHPPRLHMSRQLPSMSLLLTCSQIYNEARFLPLRYNTFDFFRWYGSNVFECRQFLRRLQDWQISQLRSIQLAVTEADFKRPDAEVLGTSDAECALADVCDAVGPYLRSLVVNVSVIFDRSFDWPAAASDWLPNGLAFFTELRSLQIIIDEKIIVTSEDLEKFRSHISQMLPRCSDLSIRSLKLEAEKAEKAAMRLQGTSRNTTSAQQKLVEVHQTFIIV